MNQIQQEAVLEFRGIQKTFPGVLALDNVSFSIGRGEVHGLVGENGAGKSTLIKILCGVYSADQGEIWIDGKKAHITSPAEAQTCGIQVMHQEISVLQNMTVAENIMIYDMPRKLGFWTDEKRMNQIAREVLDSVGLDYVNPKKPMSGYSLATQQMINLARILSTNPHVVLLDEPTASLTMNEAQELFQVIRRFQAKGVSIIYISHYLDEVINICDRISVLRDGKYVKTFDAKATTNEEIVTAMIGKKLKAERRTPEERGEVVLTMENVSGPSIIKHIGLELHRNEVLGLYGLNGAGKTETFRAITGADKILEGKITLNGQDITNRSIGECQSRGLMYVTEDRRRQGLVLGMSVRENAALGNEKKYSKASFISVKKEKADVQTYAKQMKVKTPSMETQVGTLSGGNQQKVILARCLARNSKIFLLDEPTVGIDVGAREEIYTLISEIVKEGASIILASSDLNEILQVCDRVAILAGGSIVKTMDIDEASEETLLLYAMGDEKQ